MVPASSWQCLIVRILVYLPSWYCSVHRWIGSKTVLDLQEDLATRAHPSKEPPRQAIASMDSQPSVLVKLMSSTLRFHDQHTEEEYWNGQQAKKLWARDSTVCTFGVITGITLLFRLPVTAIWCLVGHLIVLYLALKVAKSIPKHSLRDIISCRGKGSFSNWRLAATLIAGLLIPIFPGASWAVDAMTSWMVWCSHMSVFLLWGMYWRLEYRTHVVLLFACSALNTLFVPRYCASCHEGSSLQFQFSSVSLEIDHMFQKIVWMGWQDDLEHLNRGRYACWMVLSFMQWSIGLLLLSAVMYCVDFFSRVRYIASSYQISRYRRCQIWRSWQSTILISAWVVLVGSMMIWEILKMVE